MAKRTKRTATAPKKAKRTYTPRRAKAAATNAPKELTPSSATLALEEIRRFAITQASGAPFTHLVKQAREIENYILGVSPPARSKFAITYGEKAEADIMEALARPGAVAIVSGGGVAIFDGGRAQLLLEAAQAALAGADEIEVCTGAGARTFDASERAGIVGKLQELAGKSTGDVGQNAEPFDDDEATPAGPAGIANSALGEGLDVAPGLTIDELSGKVVDAANWTGANGAGAQAFDSDGDRKT